MRPPPGVILAGGQGRRMGGGGKAAVTLDGVTLLNRAIDFLRPQVSALAINGDVGRGQDIPVLADEIPGRLGPLAGILTAMTWAERGRADRVVTIPVDTPFLPHDLIARLSGAKSCAIVRDQSGLHPIIGIWPVALRTDLETAVREGTRRVRDWVLEQTPDIITLPGATPPPCFNINTPNDLTEAEEWLRKTR